METILITTAWAILTLISAFILISVSDDVIIYFSKKKVTRGKRAQAIWLIIAGVLLAAAFSPGPWNQLSGVVQWRQQTGALFSSCICLLAVAILVLKKMKKRFMECFLLIDLLTVFVFLVCIANVHYFSNLIDHPSARWFTEADTADKNMLLIIAMSLIVVPKAIIELWRNRKRF